MNTERCSIAGCDQPRKRPSTGWCNAHYLRWYRHGDPLAGGTPRGDRQGSPARFYREVVLTYDGDDCLTWPFACNPDGVAQIRIGGQLKITPRLLCEDVNGPPPTPDHEAAHSCGNGHLACVTKGHLSWKTRKGNMEDMVAHGRSQRGEKCRASRLTEAQVSEIHALSQAMPQRVIAELFGVDPSTISHILKGDTWAWLDQAKRGMVH